MIASSSRTADTMSAGASGCRKEDRRERRTRQCRRSTEHALRDRFGASPRAHKRDTASGQGGARHGGGLRLRVRPPADGLPRAGGRGWVLRLGGGRERGAGRHLLSAFAGG